MRILRFVIAAAVVSAVVGAAIWIAPASPVKREPVPVSVAPTQAANVPAPQPPVAPAIQSPATVATPDLPRTPGVNPSTGAAPAAAPKPVVIKPTIPRSEETREMQRQAMRRLTQGGPGQDSASPRTSRVATEEQVFRQPRESAFVRVGSFDGDVRNLPQQPVKQRERTEREGPHPNPGVKGTTGRSGTSSAPAAPAPPTRNPPAPGPDLTFEGLDRVTWGSGNPPDTNGDVGPSHFIQSVNSSVGIYSKTGTQLAAFTLDTLMSQAPFGNICDTDNFGDPVVLYDTFEDRWVITDFAFQLDGSNNVVFPPGMFECIAVSKTGDPVAGGWWFYSHNTIGGLGDYPKFGIWPDGLYVSYNMFDYAAAGGFQNVRVAALNKAQMYAGQAAAQIVWFDLPAGEFSLLPSNARLQTGTPPAGAPNYFTSIWNWLNSMQSWKFHVDWAHVGLSTLTANADTGLPSWWAQYSDVNGRVPTPATPDVDTLYPRLMMQNQYSNIGGVESLWNSHTVGAGNPVSNVSSAQAAVRYYQIKVVSGTPEATATQAFTYSPEATLHRFMPSAAVNKNGDLAIGYNTTSATLHPSMVYAGRLAGDAVNSITLTETTLVTGAGSPSSTSSRWGDYATMTLDPNGCQFWFTSEYYQANSVSSWNTRIGAFTIPGCTANVNGDIGGRVKNAAGIGIPGAIVRIGSRTDTTDAAGYYIFEGLSPGTYPTMTATVQGYLPSTVTGVVLPNGGASTTQDFTLTAAATTNCFVDTNQLDFQTDIASVNCDAIAAPGSVVLSNEPTLDQQNVAGTTTGTPFGTPSWTGQTFLAALTGPLVKAEVEVFCNPCDAVPPNLTLSIRATSGGVPTGADLASATIPGSTFAGGATANPVVTFGAPAMVASGTTYALVLRPASVAAGTSYFWIRSSPSTYAGGSRVISADSGGSWATETSRDYNFKTYVQVGYASPGTFTSSLKDANPPIGGTVTWGNITYNATVPGSTSVTIRVAGSNNPNGPFNFVTTFASGASLAQFNGMRYLRYQATLTTSNPAVTPSLNDVQLCFTSSPRPLLDLNADGNGDVFTYNGETGAWKRAVTGVAGTFTEANGAWNPGWSVVPAKFNQDNYTDLFLFNPSNGQWVRMLNDGANSFTTQASGTWWNGWQRFVMDLDADGLSDLFLHDPASGIWFKCIPTVSDFSCAVGYWNPGWEITKMTLNSDAFGDLFLFNGTTGRWFWVLGQAGASFTYPATDVWYNGWDLYPGDFNGDGLTDLLLHDPPTGAYWTAMNNGSGTGFTFTGGYWTMGWTPYIGDLDGDGDSDIFLYNHSSGIWYKMLSNGVGGYAVGFAQIWSEGWTLHPTDLNADGRTDFFLYHPVSGVWYQALNLGPNDFTYFSGTWNPGLTIVVRSPVY